MLRLGGAEGTEAGLDDITAGQNDFERASVPGMVGIRRVAEPSLEGVANDAARRAGPGRIQPEPAAAGLQERIQLFERDPGFDAHIAELCVEQPDPVHLAQVNAKSGTSRRC